ncbi:ATP-binding cassette domain-containing protein [Candidatus Shapirobacteria bacterium]|nr:ATP-binding cassette domain-containing protein [Candidatus Shapirobacteria bacterium]
MVQVTNLRKYYQVFKKQPGLSGSIKSLFKRRYETVKAVDKISFQIGKGELIGFIGPNGAGKTTTLKCLSGLLYPDGGEISVLGFIPWERKKEYLKQISFVMGQKNQLWWDLPALETFNLNREIYEIDKIKFDKTLNELVNLLEVKDLLKIQVRKLSLGQRMKCELIAALLHQPKVLFLDEPTIGLDVVMQKKIRDFIKEYNQRYQANIILTSHYMGDVKELAKRVIIIDKGRIIFDGLLEEIIKKFANHKLISVVFSKKVEKKDLKGLGRIKSFEPLKADILVKRKLASFAAAEMLQRLPIEDVNITEPSIEDIIRELFTGKDYA